MRLSKMGRPTKDIIKVKSVGVRMTEDEHRDLQLRAAEHNLTITQAIQKGIRLLYDSWDSEDLDSLP